jgi:transcriptional regulator with XRE-family HTH domain
LHKKEVFVLSIINRIRTLSKENGISLSYICKKMDVNRVYFIDCEKSGRTIPDDKLAIIADALHTSVEYLKGETEQKEKQPTLSELSEKQKRLIKIIEGMSDDQLDRFEKILAVVETTEL